MNKIYVLLLEMKLFYYDYVFKFQVRCASIILKSENILFLTQENYKINV